MPSVVNSADVVANGVSLKRAMDKGARVTNLKGYSASGVYVIEKSYTVGTASVDEIGDEYHFFTFPLNCHLIDLRVKTADLDTGTSVLRANIITDDGSTETTLITGSASFAAAAGSASLDAGADPTAFAVGGKDLAMKVTTAANVAAAGAVTVRAVVLLGAPRRLTSW